MTMSQSERTFAAFELFRCAEEIRVLSRSVGELTQRDYAMLDQMVTDLTRLSRQIVVIETRQRIAPPALSVEPPAPQPETPSLLAKVKRPSSS
jgi:hypothetical protein